VVRPTLAIVAFREERPTDVEALLMCLVSLRQTAPDVQVLLIDTQPTSSAGTGDREPAPSTLAEAAAAELGCAYVAQEDGAGTLAAAVAGLELAHSSGFDAVLVGPDLELQPGWLEALRARRDTAGRPAAVAGGMLRFADGLVEHAGFFYSLLLRRWLPRYSGVPAEVAETRQPALCPVSGQLQLIRHEALVAAGLPDPELGAPYAEIDFCLRVFAAGLECVYEPAAVGRSPRLALQGLQNETVAERLAGARLESRHAPGTFDRFIPDVL
jgi:GT2 family glycosyltransferase